MNKAMMRQYLGVVEMTTSLESLEGVTQEEREYEIYGRVDDLAAMKAAASRSEYQEQWGLPCNAGVDAGVFGNIRVRMTREGDDGEPKYTQTIKVKKDTGNDENEMDISAGTFEIFSRLVPTGLLKTRYFFPLEGTDYELEVDVFHSPDGKQCPVVKIDLEVPEGATVDQIKIPFKLEDVRVIKPGKKSPEDADFARNLFANHYEFKNPLHIKAAPEQPVEPVEPGEGETQGDAQPA